MHGASASPDSPFALRPYMRLGVAFTIATIVLTAAFAMSLAGCGGGGSTGVQQNAQTITFTQPTSPITYAPGLTTSLSATATSGLPVTFNVDPASTGKGTVSGNTLTFTAVGKLVVDANQAGNSNYFAAAQVQVTIVVNQATPTVSVWPTASAITEGSPLSASALTGCTASVPGTCAWTTPSTVPATGTDSESVTFTPTDTTDYTTVTADVPIVVNPAVPQITALTPRYAVADDTVAPVDYTVVGAGFKPGDIFHDTTEFPDLTWPSSSATQSYFILWEMGYYEPTWNTKEGKHPGGAYGNQASTAFLGSASQSTLAVSPLTGTLVQAEQKNGQIHWQKMDGTTGTFYSGIMADSPTLITVDDVTDDVVRVLTGASTTSPLIDVYDESGDGGFPLCQINPTDMSFVSSIAAKGGYMFGADPVDNKVFIAKMDCTGYTTISITGQPWSVAMTDNGTETDAYVLSRDECANGIPCVKKIAVPSGTVEGSVDLTGVTPISAIRDTMPNAGVNSLVASNKSSTALALSMSDPTDGKVLTINTDTSNGAKMEVAYTTPITDLPIGITLQESASDSTLLVAYIAADTMDAVTHIGALDPTTGNYTPAIGACQTGILAGGFVATSNGVYCAQGAVIAPPLVLQP